jgi:hypothetical protein
MPHGVHQQHDGHPGEHAEGDDGLVLVHADGSECHEEGDIYFDVTLGLYEAKYDGEHVVHHRSEH